MKRHASWYTKSTCWNRGTDDGTGTESGCLSSENRAAGRWPVVSIWSARGRHSCHSSTCPLAAAEQRADAGGQHVHGWLWPILLKSSVLEARASQAFTRRMPIRRQELGVHAPRRQAGTGFPISRVSAPTTSPFFVHFARWLPSGTHRACRTSAFCLDCNARIALASRRSMRMIWQ